MFYKISNYYEMFIKVQGASLFLTVPAHDIYNELLLFYKIDQPNFSFRFDKYQFTKINKEQVSKVNMHDKSEELLMLKPIDEEVYNKKTKKQSRNEYLSEQYVSSDDFYKFRYDFVDSGLNELRRITNMDEWIDNSNEFTKMMSISKWINNNIKHDGKLHTPYKNGIELLKIASSNGGFLNCRGIAVLANELNLAASLFSKFVICMQKEMRTDNYHVLNTVYINDLKKWVMIDPTYNVYLKNKSNEVLSIMDIRNSLRDNNHLFSNKEANYYGKKLSVKLYLRSLTKNFYRFSIPINSKFNGDQLNNIINLVPDKEKFPSIYSVDNPEQFWKEPII